MKKRSIFFSVILTTLTIGIISAQPITWEKITQSNFVLKSVPLTEDVKQSIVNFANSSFQPSVVYYQSWQQGVWAELTKWEYPSYDSEGRATEYISYSYSDGTYMPAGKEFYSYSNGTLITTTQRYQDGAWVNYNRLTYSNFYGDDYDYNTFFDLLIENWVDGNWVPLSNTVLTYDQNNYPELSSTEIYTDGNWNPSGQNIYTYNQNGQLIEEINQYYSEGQFQNSGKSEYTYEQNGFADVNTFYYWGESDWLQSSRTNYDYDANNMISVIHNFAPIEGNWVENARFTYSYQNGILGGYLHEILNVDEWIDYRRLVTTIDANDNITEYLYQNNSGGVWVNASRMVYEYVEVTSVEEEQESLPAKYILSQNYPNPFNPSTTIKFSIPQSGYVSLKVYDVTGREVANLVSENLSSGSYSVSFNTDQAYGQLSSGIYFYRLEANNFNQTKKLMLIK